MSVNKNLVTRALGIENAVTVDIHEDAVSPGDIYLLCSDGLSDMLEDKDIANVLSLYGDNIDLKADHLITQANVNGGRDNISVLLARPNVSFPLKRPWHRQLMDWILRNG